MTKIPHQIAQLFLNINLMLIHLPTALALPLRVPSLLIERNYSVLKDIM